MKRLLTLIFALALLAMAVSAQAEDPIIGEWHSVSLISGGIAQDIKDMIILQIVDDGSVRDLNTGTNSETWSKNGDQYDFIPGDESVDKATCIIDGDNMTMVYTDDNLQFTFVRANASAAKSATIETPKADANGKDSNTEANLGVVDGVYYVYEGLPDYMQIINTSHAVSIYPTGQSDAREVPTDGSAVLTSGQDGNVSMLVFEKRDGEFWSYVAVGNPGKYDYHVTLESEHYVNEQDCSAYVFSWDEYPLITLHDEHTEIPEITVKIGESFVPPELFDRVATDNTEQIAGSMGKTYDKDGFRFDFNNAALENEFTKEWITNKYYSYTATKEGSYEGILQHRLWGNVGLIVRINVVSYGISGPGQVAPGQSAVYEIKDETPKDGRSFSWSVRGEGVTIDAETGTLQVAEDAVVGSAFTVIATPSDHGIAAILPCEVGNSLAGAEQSDSWILDGYAKVDAPIQGRGFILPIFIDQRFETIDMGSGESIVTLDKATGDVLVVQYDMYTNKDSKENREDALAAYDEINSGVTKGESGILEVQGHPALYTIIEQDEEVIIGILDYVRNLNHVRIRLLSYNTEGNPRKITVNDMTKLAELIGYDENDVEIKQADGTPVIATEEETHVLTAGKKKDFWCNYANGFAIKYNPKLDVIEWSVVDAETGEAAEGVKISAKGQLTADKSINQVKNVKVVAYNPVFHASGEYEMTVIPAVKKVSTDPAEVFLYEGSDATVTVLAVLDPDTVPLTGITWTLKKEGIAEMNAADDGTATFKAQAAGKTQVTVKEPGGKSAVLKVNVVEPVTEVTLSAKGKAAPGKTVTVSAALEPKKAGNKNLEWSLDVDETVATINAKGQVKIAREAEAGTVITVTCKALGAPEPVVSTLQITVE